MIDFDLISRSIIAGILGGEFAEWLSTKDRTIKIPPFVLYSLCFTIIYSLALLFVSVVYFTKGFPIHWSGLFVVSSLISFSISLFVFVVDKFKNY